MTRPGWQLTGRTLTLALLLALEACSTNTPRSSSQPQTGGSSEQFFQVSENGHLAVQIRCESTEACLKMRQATLNAAEKSAPGRGAKEMTNNLSCTPVRAPLPYTLANNGDIQFATREGCEHYAIVKGLMPPHPLPGSKPVCVSVRK